MSIEKPLPEVSVVIPTRSRSALLRRAVDSVLCQTFDDFEIVVVIDGHDDESVRMLSSIHDPRVRYIVNDESQGGAEARNIGVRAARGEYIALLDDDDEFLPRKLEIQLASLKRSQFADPIGYCKILFKYPTIERVWPRRRMHLNEPMSEYLFCRRWLFIVEGFMQTNMIVCRREIFLATPMTKGLRNNQDFDWLLRVARVPGVGFEFTDEVLAKYYIEQDRNAISKAVGWTASYEWCRGSRALFTPAAYSSYLVWFVGRRAAMEHRWEMFWRILREIIVRGGWSCGILSSHCVLWLMPSRLRQIVRSLVSRRSAA